MTWSVRIAWQEPVAEYLSCVGLVFLVDETHRNLLVGEAVGSWHDHESMISGDAPVLRNVELYQAPSARKWVELLVEQLVADNGLDVNGYEPMKGVSRGTD